MIRAANKRGDYLVQGYCPACGNGTLTLTNLGAIHCDWEECPNPWIMGDILNSPEIHHIVNIDAVFRVFNAQHPLRERARGSLLNCAIHEEVKRFIADNPSADGVWRVKHRDDIPDEYFNEWPYVWEKL